MKFLASAVLMVVSMPAMNLAAQDFPEREAKVIQWDIELLEEKRDQAFRNGECEEVIGHFDENVVFYARGRRLPSISAILELCRRAPRPFPIPKSRTRQIHALSEDTAYVVRVMDFEPTFGREGNLIREVETTLWLRSGRGWKIVHFHLSVTPISGR